MIKPGFTISVLIWFIFFFNFSVIQTYAPKIPKYLETLISNNYYSKLDVILFGIVLQFKMQRKILVFGFGFEYKFTFFSNFQNIKVF